MKFGEKLRMLRIEKHMHQESVAQACGISRRTYIGYEQEGRYPRKREVYGRLARVLGVDVNYLLTEDEEFVSLAAMRFGSRGRRQAEELVAELTGLFAGGELSEADRDAVMIALQKAYFDAKEDNNKFIPKKYRRQEAEEPQAQETEE